MADVLIVVDCQYDFIDGSLACENAENAVNNIIEYNNNNNNLKVFYSADGHKITHHSFTANNHGGAWPVHCVAGTHGAEIHKDFYNKILNPENRPDEHKNIYFKACEDEIDEYSAFNAKNYNNKILHEEIDAERDNIIICGIASEFCVRESVLAFFNNNFKVKLLENALAWVNHDGHVKNLSDLKAQGIEII
ncbi:MAG: isochorismatase family protein [Synergistaceae bacterium]|nr:isochorismatase family protein [Synergistaceae bacterium]